MPTLDVISEEKNSEPIFEVFEKNPSSEFIKECLLYWGNQLHYGKEIVDITWSTIVDRTTDRNTTQSEGTNV